MSTVCLSVTTREWTVFKARLARSHTRQQRRLTAVQHVARCSVISTANIFCTSTVVKRTLPAGSHADFSPIMTRFEQVMLPWKVDGQYFNCMLLLKVLNVAYMSIYCAVTSSGLSSAQPKICLTSLVNSPFLVLFMRSGNVFLLL